MYESGVTAEQNIGKWREAEVLLTKGAAAAQVCEQIRVAEQTYYRLRREYEA